MLALRVEGDGQRERWLRRFGDKELITTQFQRGRTLWESMGPLSFGMHLSVVEGALRFVTEYVRLFGFPLPRVLAPRVSALAEGLDATRWTVRVELAVPPLGPVGSYEGEVQLR